MSEKAAILYPEGEVNELYIARALNHCQECKYAVYGIVRTWEAAFDLIARREVQVIVVARRDHIDPNWAPRVEVAGEFSRIVAASTRGSANQRIRQRRARFLRRD